MSSGAPVPYVAPWKTAWTQYSTQIVLFPRVNATNLVIDVPTGQWWRIVYINAQLTTAAGGTGRPIQFKITDANGNVVLLTQAPFLQVASTTMTYLLWPGATPYENTGDTLSESQTWPIPDLLWPQGFEFRMQEAFAQAGDSFGESFLAVEIYAESYNEQGAPVLVPLPTLA